MKPIALALLLLAACATPDSGSPSTTLAPPTTTDGAAGPHVMLEVRDEGGFVPVEFSIGRMPRYVLMSDGTLYGPGMVTLEFPGKLLPSVTAVKIADSNLSDIRQYIDDIGFSSFDQLRDVSANSTVADATDTVVTYFDDGGEHVFSVYALGIASNPGDVRVALLSELVRALDTANAGGAPAGEFQPERVEVLAAVQQVPVDPQFQNEQPWPLDVKFADMAEAGAGYRCVALEGTAMESALEAFGAANSATSWNDGTTTYTIVVKYLYPQQEGC